MTAHISAKCPDKSEAHQLKRTYFTALARVTPAIDQYGLSEYDHARHRQGRTDEMANELLVLVKVREATIE